ncbi:MAG: DUF4292 domain-containing protein [Bacteroidales bacterium]|nr:DUF4292 domain-containing protein [Bacteroidales bacterium]
MIYSYLTLKFSGKVQWGNTAKSIRGIVKTKRDSIIWISLYHSTGIPVAKIMMTKDSLIFLNRLNDTYYAGNYDFLENQLNFSLTFNNVQSVLFNELFLYNDTVTKLKELKDFKRYADTACYVLQSVKKKAFRKYSKKQRKNKRIRRKWRDGFIVQDFKILPKIYKIKNLSVRDITNKMTFSTDYDNFETFLDKPFPQNMKISIFTPKDTVITNLKVKKLIKNESLKFSFKIPSKATKIE